MVTFISKEDFNNYCACCYYGGCIYGIIIVNASNSNPEKSQTQRFYTSITVQPDDTLWNIADSYASDGESHQQYINAVKSLNNMTDDTIYSGQNIVIYYTK